MAKAIDFPERNDYLGKPPDMTDNQCYALPICRIVTTMPPAIDGDMPATSQAHLSFWQLTPDEIMEIVKTGGIWLKVIGGSTFPLSIHGVKPIFPGDRVYTKQEIADFKAKDN